MATLQNRLEALASAIGVDVKQLRNFIGILSNLTTDAKGNLVFAINEVDLHADVIDAKIGGTQGAIGGSVGMVGDKTIVQALTKLYADIGAETTARMMADQAQGMDVAEIQAYLDQLIKDDATAGDVTHVFSADKVLSLLNTLESKILGGMAPEMLDTIKELADYLSDSGIANGIVQQLSKKVDVSFVQNFTAMEQTQGRQNIGAAADSELQTLLLGLGDYQADLVALYTAAKV